MTHHAPSLVFPRNNYATKTINALQSFLRTMFICPCKNHDFLAVVALLVVTQNKLESTLVHELQDTAPNLAAQWPHWPIHINPLEDTRRLQFFGRLCLRGRLKSWKQSNIPLFEYQSCFWKRTQYLRFQLTILSFLISDRQLTEETFIVYRIFHHIPWCPVRIAKAVTQNRIDLHRPLLGNFSDTFSVIITFIAPFTPGLLWNPLIHSDQGSRDLLLSTTGRPL